MEQKYETVSAIARMILNALGAFLAGKGTYMLLGQPITEFTWQLVAGVVLSLLAVIWSIREKNVKVEKREGVYRQLATAVLAALGGYGFISEQDVVMWSGIIASFLPLLASLSARQKIRDLKASRLRIGLNKSATPMQHSASSVKGLRGILE